MAIVAAERGYRGGRYRARSIGSRVVLYGLIVVVALWLVGPFVWLFVTSVSYQRNLLARPLAWTARREGSLRWIGTWAPALLSLGLGLAIAWEVARELA